MRANSYRKISSNLIAVEKHKNERVNKILGKNINLLWKKIKIKIFLLIFGLFAL